MNVIDLEVPVHDQRSVLERLAGVSNNAGTLRAAAFHLLYNLQNRLGHIFYRCPAPKFSPLLNLGCGHDKFPGWVNADCYNFYLIFKGVHIAPDWMLDATRPWRCPDNHWEGVYCEHMIEHLSYVDAAQVFSEILRTLVPGGTLRLIVPDVARFVSFYNGRPPAPEYGQFSFGAEAIAHLTQNWGHISAWDAPLLLAVLSEVGFVDVHEVQYREGQAKALLMDTHARRWESVYIEARKPERAKTPSTPLG